MQENENLFPEIEKLLSKKEPSKDEILYPIVLDHYNAGFISYGLSSYLESREFWLELASGEDADALINSVGITTHPLRNPEGYKLNLLFDGIVSSGTSFEEGLASDLKNRFHNAYSKVVTGENITIEISQKELKEIGRLLGPNPLEDIDEDSMLREAPWLIFCEAFVALHDSFVTSGGDPLPELREQFNGEIIKR